MDLENSKAQLKKGILEYCILSIISRGEAYASDILEEMKESRLIVVEGTLYPLLSRLKNDGLLSYNWVESKSGPPRKYYQLTEPGQLFMAELSHTWNDLVSAVTHIIHKTKINN
ncbi:MAG: PadR family transcriptional regulator [Bacteroidia bacterium]|nr:PadR family transcriptional regulator [Bacteroidia bacterium]